jgi:cell wall assembly regulator SMI1
MYEWLAHRVAQAKEVLQDFSMDWGFVLNSPASEAEISNCESELGVRLPSSYREFLLEFNGVELFYPEQRNPYAPETLISH